MISSFITKNSRPSAGRCQQQIAATNTFCVEIYTTVCDFIISAHACSGHEHQRSKLRVPQVESAATNHLSAAFSSAGCSAIHGCRAARSGRFGGRKQLGVGRQSKLAAELLRKRCLRQQARLVSKLCNQQYTAVSVFTSSVTSAKACRCSVSPASKALMVCDCVQGPLLPDLLLPLRHVCAHL